MTDLPMLQMPPSGNELLRWPTGCTMAGGVFAMWVAGKIDAKKGGE